MGRTNCQAWCRTSGTGSSCRTPAWTMTLLGRRVPGQTTSAGAPRLLARDWAGSTRRRGGRQTTSVFPRFMFITTAHAEGSTDEGLALKLRNHNLTILHILSHFDALYCIQISTIIQHLAIIYIFTTEIIIILLFFNHK